MIYVICHRVKALIHGMLNYVGACVVLWEGVPLIKSGIKNYGKKNYLNIYY